ncbi:hypothetical protein [Krasilnikovia sp. MM14-A1259]|uniref:hypothetical protein n=1 Tax=Krasilnikovia sp. MM14-A1259 TaxID=3373539 RepID=UPI0038105984
MFRPSRSALAATALSMAAGAFAMPVAAYAADTTTSLSATQMVAELKTVATTSTTAGASGWNVNLAATVTLGDAITVSGAYVYDPLHKAISSRIRVANRLFESYAVGGRGLYQNLADPDMRAAVRMMGRPEVKYAFATEPSLNVDTLVNADGPAPSVVLTEDVSYAGTKTVHDDGTTDYAYHTADDEAYTIHVGTDGSLATIAVADSFMTETLTYSYGPQVVTVPAASTTISMTVLERGIRYLHMSQVVKGVGQEGASRVLRKADGHIVKVASLRKIVRAEVKADNKIMGMKMIKVKNVSHGVRLSATNPWTHKSISYTVKASGRKVVVGGRATTAALGSGFPAAVPDQAPLTVPSSWLDARLLAASVK